MGEGWQLVLGGSIKNGERAKCGQVVFYSMSESVDEYTDKLMGCTFTYYTFTLCEYWRTAQEFILKNNPSSDSNASCLQS